MKNALFLFCLYAFVLIVIEAKVHFVKNYNSYNEGKSNALRRLNEEKPQNEKSGDTSESKEPLTNSIDKSPTQEHNPQDNDSQQSTITGTTTIDLTTTNSDDKDVCDTKKYQLNFIYVNPVISHAENCKFPDKQLSLLIEKMYSVFHFVYAKITITMVPFPNFEGGSCDECQNIVHDSKVDGAERLFDGFMVECDLSNKASPLGRLKKCYPIVKNKYINSQKNDYIQRDVLLFTVDSAFDVESPHGTSLMKEPCERVTLRQFADFVRERQAFAVALTKIEYIKKWNELFEKTHMRGLVVSSDYEPKDDSIAKYLEVVSCTYVDPGPVDDTQKSSKISQPTQFPWEAKGPPAKKECNCPPNRTPCTNLNLNN